MQIFGGMGLMDELPIERFWRDARVERIWDGTSEIQRHIISRVAAAPPRSLSDDRHRTEPVRTRVEADVWSSPSTGPRPTRSTWPPAGRCTPRSTGCSRRSGLRVGVLTGAGERFFSAGWDLKAAAAGEPIDADHGPGGFAGLTEFLYIGKPVIAAVNGLASAAVSSSPWPRTWWCRRARRVRADRGDPGHGGRRRRPAAAPAPAPAAVAAEMLLTGRRMAAEEAYRWGLANRVVPGRRRSSTRR